MHYITYCNGCGAITGHEANLHTLTCKKCGRVSKAPVLKWVAGGVILTASAVLSIWIIVTSISVLASLF